MPDKMGVVIRRKNPPADIARQVNSGPPPIVVLSPSLGTRKALQPLVKHLELSGYIAIIGDPSAVKIIETITVAPMAAITRAALRAIRKDTNYATRPAFANAICDLLAPPATDEK